MARDYVFIVIILCVEQKNLYCVKLNKIILMKIDTILAYLVPKNLYLLQGSPLHITRPSLNKSVL